MRESNTNYFSERSQDLLWHVVDAVRASIYSPFRFIKRAIGLPVKMVQLFNPNGWVSFAWTTDDIGAREMTHLSIDNGFYDAAKLPKGVQDISKEKLHQVLDRTTAIAEQMGVKQGVRVYSGEIQHDDCTLGAAKTSTTTIPVYISPRTLNCSDEVINFVIAHELSHSFNNDILYEGVASLSVFAIEVLAYFFISPFAITFIEGAASVYENYCQRTKELAADKKAITLLGSSEGLVQFCNHGKEYNLKIRENSIKAFRENKDVYFGTPMLSMKILRKGVFFFSKEVVVSNVSPEGGNRFDLKHPSDSERTELALALNL